MKDYLINQLVTSGEYKYPISTEKGLIVRTIRKFDQLVSVVDVHAKGSVTTKEMSWIDFKKTL